MRLIDAEEAKQFLKENLILPEKSYEAITSTMLDAVPTAYDLEKVVEQLEKEKELAYKRYKDCNSFTPAVVYTRYAAQYQERRECLETVKSGYRNSVNEMTKETE